MNRRIYSMTLPVLIGLVLSVTIARAQDQSREFHWSGKLAAEQIVEVKGVNGDIDAEGTGGDQVEVTAEKSGPRADEVEIKVVPNEHGVTICAIYPGGIFGGHSGPCEAGTQWHTSNIHGNETKIHFTVHMPKNLRFSGQNVNGSLNAKAMGRVVRAVTVNGAIRVSTTAWAEAETVNGSIEASMGTANWTNTLKFESVNGSIELRMPDDLSAEVNFETVNGRISSDFPITISGGFVGHSAHGRVGSGGRELVVKTVNGSVGLKKAGGEI